MTERRSSEVETLTIRIPMRLARAQRPQADHHARRRYGGAAEPPATTPHQGPRPRASLAPEDRERVGEVDH